MEFLGGSSGVRKRSSFNRPEHRPPSPTKVQATHKGPRSPHIPGGAKALRGYIKAKDKHQLQNRLRRIEGQVRGLQRMVEEEAYCVEILTQIASIVSASEKVALILLEDHVEHCVREAVGDGQKADEKVAELAVAVERFLRI
jgi:CsoR family transcriptional regulator, copper-sensing transcriptional repressor